MERGKYRKSEDDMRVVSGQIDKPKIHFIAPPASKIPKEMDQFISWFNRTAPGGKAPLSPLIRAGITHLYFVTRYVLNFAPFYPTIALEEEGIKKFNKENADGQAADFSRLNGKQLVSRYFVWVPLDAFILILKKLGAKRS